jgi:hypothetical protein
MADFLSGIEDSSDGTALPCRRSRFSPLGVRTARITMQPGSYLVLRWKNSESVLRQGLSWVDNEP